RPTGSGKVRNPACGLVDNTARLRILTSSQFPPRPDIITDLLRADIFKNLQHPWERGNGMRTFFECCSNLQLHIEGKLRLFRARLARERGSLRTGVCGILLVALHLLP